MNYNQPFMPGVLGQPTAPTFNPYPVMPSTTAVNLPRTEVIRVHGLEGAKAYQMTPSSSVLLLDETDPIVWLKTTDGAGYPTITGYTITPIENTSQPDSSTFQATIDSLEKRIAKLENEWEGK